MGHLTCEGELKSNPLPLGALGIPKITKSPEGTAPHCSWTVCPAVITCGGDVNVSSEGGVAPAIPGSTAKDATPTTETSNVIGKRRRKTRPRPMNSCSLLPPRTRDPVG